jgi:hypothetical protein
MEADSLNRGPSLQLLPSEAPTGDSRTDAVPPVQCHVLYFTDKVIILVRRE